jgi:hypothetical protein
MKSWHKMGGTAHHTAEGIVGNNRLQMTLFGSCQIRIVLLAIQIFALF